jgi:pimeloyl-ACP methyl ester carboxylesterase
MSLSTVRSATDAAPRMRTVDLGDPAARTLRRLGASADWPKDISRQHLPVLLIHGHRGSAASWRQLVEHLTNAGFTVVRAIYNSTETAPSALCGAAVEMFSVVCDVAAAPALHVVGHSLGGLIARSLASRLPPGSCPTLITVAAPYRGAWMAYADRSGGGQALRPHSVWLAELNGTTVPSDVLWVNYCSRRDLVAPLATTWAAPPAINVSVPRGHLRIVKSGELARDLMTRLLASEECANMTGHSSRCGGA